MVQESGVARVDPPAVEGLPRGLRVLRVALEDARAPEQHLAGVRDADLDAGDRRADGVEPHVAVPLDRHEHAGLGHAVQLLDVDPEPAEEEEDLRADRFAGGVRAAHVREAEVVLERAVHEQVAQRIEEPLPECDGLSAETAAHDLLG